MTKVTRQKIFEKIQQLDEYISHLHQIRDENEDIETFLKDFHSRKFFQFSIKERSYQKIFILDWKD